MNTVKEYLTVTLLMCATMSTYQNLNSENAEQPICLSSVNSNFFKNLCNTFKRNHYINIKNQPIIQPEILNKYITKSKIEINDFLISKGFSIISNRKSSDGLYICIYKYGSQKIDVSSYKASDNKADRVIFIETSTDDSYLFNEEMSREKIIYLSETRHTELLNAYGFKKNIIKSNNSEDGIIYMYKGNASNDSYIECSFYMGGDFVTHMTFGTQGD